MTDDTTRTVKIDPAPAADQAAGVSAEISPTDAVKGSNETLSDGRVIRLRKPTSPLVQFSLVRNMGPEIAQNQTLMQMINPLVYIEAIDGEPVYLPASYIEVEALINRLGEEGINTVLGWYMRYVHLPAQQAMDEALGKAQRDAIKN